MILAFNGSPRLNGNTASMLQAALDGAASTGAETKLIHLYPLKFKGCVSCFSCKIKGGRHGFCAKIKKKLTSDSIFNIEITELKNEISG